MRLKLVSVTVALATALALSATAFAKPDQDKKEYVCHFTASQTNPVVVVNIGNAAVEHHVANHHPEVHQGEDFASNEPPTDCAAEPPPEG